MEHDLSIRPFAAYKSFEKVGDVYPGTAQFSSAARLVARMSAAIFGKSTNNPGCRCVAGDGAGPEIGIGADMGVADMSKADIGMVGGTCGLGRKCLMVDIAALRYALAQEPNVPWRAFDESARTVAGRR